MRTKAASAGMTNRNAGRAAGAGWGMWGILFREGQACPRESVITQNLWMFYFHSPQRRIRRKLCVD